MDTNEKCCICGKPLTGCLKGWTEQGVCSGQCWAELYGELDCDDNEDIEDE